MQPIRSPRQVVETLDYMGDIVAELARMAGRDDHRLLSYILHTARIEIEELKQARVGPSAEKADQTA